MASQGPLSAGTGANVSAGESIDWLSPENITSSNDTYSTANGDSSVSSQYLEATNFGFTVPVGATINGVVVEIERKSDGGLVSEVMVKLLKAGVVSGNDKSDGSPLPTTEATKSYGGAADLWGVVLAVADVNASNFGAAFGVGWTPDEDTAYVDHIRITVYYTAAAGGVTARLVAITKIAQVAGPLARAPRGLRLFRKQLEIPVVFDGCMELQNNTGHLLLQDGSGCFQGQAALPPQYPFYGGGSSPVG